MCKPADVSNYTGLFAGLTDLCYRISVTGVHNSGLARVVLHAVIDYAVFIMTFMLLYITACHCI